MTQMTEKKKPLIILTGPTAVGKTAASIGLAFRRIRCRYTGTWILVPQRFCRKR